MFKFQKLKAVERALDGNTSVDPKWTKDDWEALVGLSSLVVTPVSFGFWMHSIWAGIFAFCVVVFVFLVGIRQDR